MKGLKIIPLFFALIVLSYLGMMFVRQNPQDVIVRFGDKSTSPTALGFVILTSALVGMIVAGALCSVELMVLYMQKKKMKRKLFPRSPGAETGVVPSLLTKRLSEDLNDDVDERLRDASEPRNDNTGSGLP
jgi:uncharacterized integral membrane protein